MRKLILNMLLENREDYISGEYISKKLGVSRTAVWKNINALREAGYTIDSVSNKGYQLKEIPDIIDDVHLNKMLKTSSLGRNIKIYESIGSTNTKAKELALNGAPHGTLIIADEQTEGKGRRGRRWVSRPGTGLWMTLLLRPTLPPQFAPQLTIIAALSTVKAIAETTQLEPQIKWPNDIIINSKKVCGILTEIQAEPEVTNYIVVGIGINVNGSSAEMPDELSSIATTLEEEAGKGIRRMELAASLLNKFEPLYEEYVSTHDLSFVLDEYKKYSATLNKHVKVIGAAETFEGIVTAITNDGTLLVRTEDDSTREVLSGDVSIRGRDGYI